jgi:hypothetical protein
MPRSRSLQHRPRGEFDGGGVLAGDVRHDPAQALPLDFADRLVRAGALLGGPRLAIGCSRIAGSATSSTRQNRNVPVLLISAGQGRHLYTGDAARPECGLSRGQVLADTPSRVGREIYRVPVLGTIDRLKPWSRGSTARMRRKADHHRAKPPW